MNTTLANAILPFTTHSLWHSIIAGVSALVAAIGVQAQPTGPWNSPLRYAISADGRNFVDRGIFQDSSGVPCVVRIGLTDTLVCVFQWFREPRNTPSWDRVAVKISSNLGATWTEPHPIKIKNLPPTYQRPFDPTLVATPQGLRIYYSSTTEPPHPGVRAATFSAIGSDGIDYLFEPQPRFQDSAKSVIDPAVIIHRGIYHLLAPKGAPQDGAFHAVSEDGLSFTRVQDLISDNTHNWTGNLMHDADSTLRFYGSGPKIWFSTTNDMEYWGHYISTEIRGGDPSVVYLGAELGYLMIYVGPPYPTRVEDTEADRKSRYVIAERSSLTTLAGIGPERGNTAVVAFGLTGSEKRLTLDDNGCLNTSELTAGIWLLRLLSRTDGELEFILIVY